MFFPDITFNRGYDSFSFPFLSRQELRAEEMERRRQIQRQEELERRKRIQQYDMERHTRLIQRRQRHEEEMKRELQRQQQLCEWDYAFPPRTIIRGRDGRLYKNVTDSCFHGMEDRDPNYYYDNAFNSDQSTVDCDDDTLNSDQSTIDSNETSCSSDLMEIEYVNNDDRNSSQMFHLNPAAADFIPQNSREPKKKTFTLLVEDVPNDEDEELRDLHSVWRNRAPSPGQWMEPVESFGR